MTQTNSVPQTHRNWPSVDKPMNAADLDLRKPHQRSIGEYLGVFHKNCQHFVVDTLMKNIFQSSIKKEF